MSHRRYRRRRMTLRQAVERDLGGPVRMVGGKLQLPSRLNVKRRGNPVGQNWYPSLIAIGRDDRSYMALAVSGGGSYGWDFPTLRGMFPVDFDPRRIGLFEGRAGYAQPEQLGYSLFKVRSGGKWTKPLPLGTRITMAEFERVTGIRSS